MVAFSFMFLFAGLVGFFAGRKATSKTIFAAFSCMLLFALVAGITVSMVERTIRILVNDAQWEGSSHYSVEQLLDNRWILQPGWYEVVEGPIARTIFANFGDTTEYVSLAIRADGIGPLKIAFPIEDWKLVPPRPEVKWLRERWTLVSLPQPQPKAIRLEMYEEREYAPKPRIVEARF